VLHLRRNGRRQIDDLTHKAAIAAETLAFSRISPSGVAGVSATLLEFERGERMLCARVPRCCNGHS